jgi:hypothetical protein
MKEELEQPRRIVIDLYKRKVEVSPESQHTSDFELASALQSLIQSIQEKPR